MIPGFAPDRPRTLLGVSSGTSADGIDLALLEVAGAGLARQVRFLAGGVADYSPGVQQEVLRSGRWGLPELAHWHARLGLEFGRAARAFLDQHGYEPHQLTAIGSHGQTIYHHDGESADGSWQIGDPCQIALQCGVPVIADFRWNDLAAGGQGAPVSAFADWVLHHGHAEQLAILNLGGLANLTLLQGEQPPQAWDSGPANGPLDALMRHHAGEAFDLDGRTAAGGRVCEKLLGSLQENPWFRRPLPRSTGLERFGKAFLMSLPGGMALPDLLQTCAALAAWAVAESLEAALGGPLTPGFPLFLCGGGAHNPALVEALRQALPNARLRPYAVLAAANQAGGSPADGAWPAAAPGGGAGLDDLREAAAFALLADAFLCREAASWPTTTGAARPTLLGKFIPAPI